MDLTLCAALCCGISTTGGLREVQIVRFRRERRWRGLERRQLRRIGYGQGCGYGCSQGKLMRSVVVVAASKSAEGVSVNERTGRRVERARSLEELAEGGESLAQVQGRSLVHAVHESARVCLVRLEKQKTLASRPWFRLKWPGVDKNAWMKALSYQVRGLHCCS
jgi:hypothetical protein